MYKYWGTDEEVEISGYYSLETKTTKPKVRKEIDNDVHWMHTPNWWIHYKMDKPQRRASKVWEASMKNTYIPSEELEQEDPPLIGRKPHIYFW